MWSPVSAETTMTGDARGDRLDGDEATARSSATSALLRTTTGSTPLDHATAR